MLNFIYTVLKWTILVRVIDKKYKLLNINEFDIEMEAI